MGSFKAARLTNNDLLSSFDDAVGELERQICDAFGFTIDENITESPITFSNAGLVTKAQLRREVETGADFDSFGTIGYTLSDTGGGGIGYVRYLTGAGSVTDETPEVGFGSATSTNALFIRMTDGALFGNTTQDATNEPLIPATGMLPAVLEGAYYYNAQGVWAKPGVRPFAGCILTPTETTVLTGANEDQLWTEVVDVGGYFTSAAPTLVTIPTGGDGKYLIDVNLAGALQSGTIVRVDAAIVKNASDILTYYTQYATPLDIHTPNHGRFLTTASLVATDTIKVVVNNDSDGTMIFGKDDVPQNGVRFTGRLCLTRIE